jgi:hypothetical protein
MKSRITCHTLHEEILTIHKTIAYFFAASEFYSNLSC